MKRTILNVLLMILAFTIQNCVFPLIPFLSASPNLLLDVYKRQMLHFSIEPEFLDVNVHPTKMELRFRDGELIFTMIRDAISDALMHKELIPEVVLDEKKKREEEARELRRINQEKRIPIPEPFEQKRMKKLGQGAVAGTDQKPSGSETATQEEAWKAFAQPAGTYEADRAAKPSDNLVRDAMGHLSLIHIWKVRPGYKYNDPWFEYHEDDGLYYRYQYGDVHKGDEGPIAVKNIIIQYCSAGYYATTDYRNINVHEDSWGYFITGGKAEDITWKKDGEFGVTHYYDATGEEIVLKPGKMCIRDSPGMMERYRGLRSVMRKARKA